MLALLHLFAAYTGARPCSLVDASDEEDTCAGESGPDEDILENDELMSILYEHVTIVAVKVQGRTRLGMCVTLIHTKGEDRKPQPKTFTMWQNKNPFLCPIAHMVAVGLHHDAFAATSIRDPEAILRARIPTRKTCIIFRWKKSKLKEPIFRELARVEGQASLVNCESGVQYHMIQT
ncbi:hypothetical protein BU23DRAFT_444207 [Bimuria novae-zelandiae CBS 107.79]|uniref:Secreted protein n=1 Tax=Bimuria novae-zelandiae CBS 107.79 TaxID=1447943 RepID=A0A6A5VUN0_9PLEO|nr:hypothetical protein BU23DRAFT_444207 [Bimuria novae-zelandiae CBS 107.79]